MKSFIYLLILLSFTLSITAQVVKKDSTDIYYLIQNDSVFKTSIDLDEVVVTGKKLSKEDEDRKKFLILQRRVIKVYPYAKAGAENLTMLNKNMAKLKTDKEKKKYLKLVENYLENEFEEQLKKLSRKDGQILIKMISRQTGKSTYDLIKELKSGWRAFWSSNTAKLFDLDLKQEYDPYNNTEDFLIESILIKAFNEKRLDKQDPAKLIDHGDLANFWREKIALAKEKKALEAKTSN